MAEMMFSGIPDPEPAIEPSRANKVGILLVALVTTVVAAMVALTPKTIPWAVRDGQLQIHARLWNGDFPLQTLRTDDAVAIDLRNESGWRPVHKQWGVNGFGLNAGRFELANGRVADVYLTSETTVVLIPRRNDVPVLVGVHEPEPLLSALRSAVK